MLRDVELLLEELLYLAGAEERLDDDAERL